MDKWYEVFATGLHTPLEGGAKLWTTEDIDLIVKNYKEQIKANEDVELLSPLVVGHPKLDAPAYGWVADVRRNGDVLEAKFVNVDSEFAEVVNAKKYAKVSIALDDKYNLRHIGFLGAKAPAVKGLKTIQFSSEKTETVYEFTNFQNSFTKFYNIFANSNNILQSFTISEHLAINTEQIKQNSINENPKTQTTQKPNSSNVFVNAFAKRSHKFRNAFASKT